MEIISKNEEIKVIGNRFFAIVREDPYPDWPIPPLMEMEIVSNNRMFFRHGTIVDDLSTVEVDEDKLRYPIYHNGVTLNIEDAGNHIGFIVVKNNENMPIHDMLGYVETYVECLNRYFNGEVYYITIYDNESQPLWPPNEIVAHRPVIDSLFGLYSKTEAVICAKNMLQEYEGE